jgi:hypothetical protein
MDVLLFAIPTQGLRYSFPPVHLSSMNMYDFYLGYCSQNCVQALTKRTSLCSYL